jgi:hypothetical protein
MNIFNSAIENGCSFLVSVQLLQIPNKILDSVSGERLALTYISIPIGKNLWLDFSVGRWIRVHF